MLCHEALYETSHAKDKNCRYCIRNVGGGVGGWAVTATYNHANRRLTDRQQPSLPRMGRLTFFFPREKKTGPRGWILPGTITSSVDATLTRKCGGNGNFATLEMDRAIVHSSLAAPLILT